MTKRAETLYAALAKTLGVPTLPAGTNGDVQLSVGENSTVTLFAENEVSLMLVSPVMALPKTVDYGATLWLLRRNFYDSPIAPFRVCCDTAGSVVVWGRVPMEGMTGETLAGLIDALAAEAELIRREMKRVKNRRRGERFLTAVLSVGEAPTDAPEAGALPFQRAIRAATGLFKPP